MYMSLRHAMLPCTPTPGSSAMASGSRSYPLQTSFPHAMIETSSRPKSSHITMQQGGVYHSYGVVRESGMQGQVSTSKTNSEYCKKYLCL